MRMEMSFPNFHVDEKVKTLMINTWEEMLKDYSYECILMALKTYVLSNTSGFAPSIGQLIEATRIVDTQTSLTETQAWEIVSRALRDSYYHADEQFQKFPEIVQRVVGSPSQLRNWGQSELETVETVIQSNFMRTYRVEVMRENQRSKAPKEVKMMISAKDSFNPMIGAGNENLIEQEDYEISTFEKVKGFMGKFRKNY